MHGAIMAVKAFSGDHMGHLRGDVLALFVVAIVLSVLVVSSGLKRSSDETGTSAGRTARSLAVAAKTSVKLSGGHPRLPPGAAPKRSSRSRRMLESWEKARTRRPDG